MKLIRVGGASSHCGKTSIVCLLLKALPGWAAVKVTPSRQDETCPLGHDCTACEPPEGSCEIVTDGDILAHPGKDTARFIEAGASRVAWVRGLPECLPNALETTLHSLTDASGVIVESTTLIPYLDGLRVMVAREGNSQIKDSARNCAGMVDLLAINRDRESSPTMTERDCRLESVFRPRHIVSVCAVLEPDHPRNRDFISYCRAQPKLGLVES